MVRLEGAPRRVTAREAGEAAGDGLIEPTLVPSRPRKMSHIQMMLSETGPYSTLPWPIERRLSRAPTSVRTQFMGDLGSIGNLLGEYELTEMWKAVEGSSAEKEKLTGRLTDLAGRANRRGLKIFRADFDTMDAKQREDKITSYAKIADAFINSFLRTDVWEPLSQYTDVMEKAETTHSITGLLDLVFNHPNRRVRFEAKRKLVLMKLAAAVDARSEELREKDRYPRFTQLLDESFWYGEVVRDSKRKRGGKKKNVKIGSVNIESHHGYETMECIEDPVEYPDRDIPLVRKRVERHKPRPGGYYIRTHHFEQRYINYDGEIIPVSQDSRPKSLLARIGKMIRKGEEDPAVAVQDTTGLMLVVRNQADAHKAYDFFARGGENGALTIDISDLEDTLSGDTEYSAEHEGSSPKTRQLKFIAKTEGISIEVIIHTYATYLNNELANEIAHDEFDLKRYQTVFSWIFPPQIYKDLYETPLRERIEAMIGYQRRLRRVADIS